MTHDALKPVDFHVLLALAEEPLHGYALVRRIEAESEGSIRVLPGNLYAILRRLESHGLLRPAEGRSDEADKRRRYFALTDQGAGALAEETARLERLVQAARSRRLVGREEGTRR
ncbi:MAG: helix-turn-helix transcriptional regulator [Acidobacteriota bacterium]